MKFIGQHIFDFIARFRNDVYLEDISTGTIASGGNLGLDSNNKIVKAAEVGSSVDLTSEVTGVLPVANGGTGASTFADNSILTGTGTSAITAESGFTYNNGTITNIGTLTLLQLDNVTNADVLSISNFDADKKVIDIEASNTTEDIIDINSSTLTTGSIINCDITQSGINTAGLLDYNITNAETATSICYFENIDFNKTGVTSDGSAFIFNGIIIDYDDTATNHANSTTSASGININLDNSSDQGTVSQTGIDITLSGGDAANTSGLVIRTPNSASDIKVKSSASGNDIFTLDTKTDGETTLTTIEDGGGSTAHFNVVADGDIVLDSATDVIKTGSTTFVNNSGVIQVATQGTIDHDSLANFVAAEHYRWDTDISGTATIHTNNITDLHGAGVSGVAGGLLTDVGNGQIGSRLDFTWDGDTLDLISSSSGKPTVNIKNTNSNAKGPTLFLINDKGAAGALNDEAGNILFRSDNASQTLVDYGKINASAISTIAGDEAGSISLQARTSDGSSSAPRNVITGTGSASDNDVDVEIGYGSTSMTTIAGDLTVTGSITGKQYQVFQTNFVDDLNTSEVFIPLHGTTFEQSTVYQDDVAILAPCDGRIVSLDLSILSVTGTGGDLTITIYTIGPNESGTSLSDWTSEETETINVSSLDDNHVFHFAFSNAKHFESTEKFALSIQASADMTGNTLMYATAVVEFDFSTLLGSTSAEFDSVP
tara:strand:+ start:113 stop:2257 length:2145 start_codon:yes stop_codon:yes gene_type:complete